MNRGKRGSLGKATGKAARGRGSATAYSLFARSNSTAAPEREDAASTGESSAIPSPESAAGASATSTECEDAAARADLFLAADSVFGAETDASGAERSEPSPILPSTTTSTALLPEIPAGQASGSTSSAGGERDLETGRTTPDPVPGSPLPPSVAHDPSAPVLEPNHQELSPASTAEAPGVTTGAMWPAIARTSIFVNSMVRMNIANRQAIIWTMSTKLWPKLDILEDPHVEKGVKDEMLRVVAMDLMLDLSVLGPHEVHVPKDRGEAEIRAQPSTPPEPHGAQNAQPPRPSAHGPGPSTALLPTPPSHPVSATLDQGGPFTMVKDRRTGKSHHAKQHTGKPTAPRAPARTFRAERPRIYMQIELPGQEKPSESQIIRWGQSLAAQWELSSHTARLIEIRTGHRLVVTGSPQSDVWTKAYSVQVPGSNQSAEVRALPSRQADPLTSLVLTTGEGLERLTRATLAQSLATDLTGIPHRLDTLGVFTRGVAGSDDEASSTWLLSLAAHESTVLRAIPILRVALANLVHKVYIQAPYSSNRFIMEDGSVCPAQGTPGVSIVGLQIQMTNESATQKVNSALSARGLPTPATSTIYRGGNELLVRAGYPTREQALQVANALRAGLVNHRGIPLSLTPSQTSRTFLLHQEGRCHFCGRLQTEGKHGFGLCYGGLVRQSEKCRGCGSTAHQGARTACPHYGALMQSTLAELQPPQQTANVVPHPPIPTQNANTPTPQASYREVLVPHTQQPIPITPPAPAPQVPRTTPPQPHVAQMTRPDPLPQLEATTRPESWTPMRMSPTTTTADQHVSSCLDLLEAASLQLSAATQLNNTIRTPHEAQRLRDIIVRLRTDSLRIHQMLASPPIPCAGQQVPQHG